MDQMLLKSLVNVSLRSYEVFGMFHGLSDGLLLVFVVVKRNLDEFLNQLDIDDASRQRIIS